MKLSDFKVEELRNMQQAIKDTRAKYDGYRDHQIPYDDGGDCPLCVFTTFDKGSVDCNYCPWYVIDDDGCVMSYYDKQEAYARRNRLDRWYNLIEEEIKRREG